MTKRQLVSSGAVWEPVVGYSRAVRVGPWIAVAGTTAATADAGPVGGGDIGEQTREALRRIQVALQQAGAQLEHVVRTRMYVTDLSRWPEVGQAHGEVLSSIRPATSMIEVRALIDCRLLVEVEADAYVPQERGSERSMRLIESRGARWFVVTLACHRRCRSNVVLAA